MKYNSTCMVRPTDVSLERIPPATILVFCKYHGKDVVLVSFGMHNTFSFSPQNMYIHKYIKKQLGALGVVMRNLRNTESDLLAMCLV